jgi:hypothetical protein
LPPFLLTLSHLLPPAYAVDAFRSALIGFSPGYPELAPFNIEVIIVTIFCLVMPPLGYLLYRRAENYARKRGSLSMY